VRGESLPLPRRERRILECLVRNRGRRLSKSQIFNAVYGIFDEDVDENVVESHISKLRKKLKHRLGYDPIDSKRFLGYCSGVPAARNELAGFWANAPGRASAPFLIGAVVMAGLVPMSADSEPCSRRPRHARARRGRPRRDEIGGFRTNN